MHPHRLTLVPPGDVHLWVPRSSTMRAFATTAPDPRPVTPDQERRLQVASVPRRPEDEVNPWIGMRATLHGADFVSFAGTLRRFCARHESLRCMFVRRDDDTFERRIVEPELIGFQPRHLGHYADRGEAFDVIMAELDDRTGPLSWPAATVLTVTEENGDITVFAAFDHVTFDGYSAYLTIGELKQHLEAELNHAPLPAPVGSYVDFAVEQRAVQGSITAESPALEPWRRAADATGNLPGLPRATGVRRGDELRHRLRFPTFAGPKLSEAFRLWCDQQRAPQPLAYTAVLLRAMVAEEDDDRITVLMSTHNRNRPEWHKAIGWFSGVVPITVDLGPELPLTEAIARCAKAWMFGKTAETVPLPLANRLLGTSMRPATVLSFMDSRHVPGREDWEEMDSTVFLGEVEPSDEMHIYINAMPYGTELAHRAPDTPPCTEWLDRVMGRMRDQMVAVTRQVNDPMEALA
ncbi:condensation domain-containing protein [Aeromicrobium duanguangcaii]|uniref:Condensation domain-containing protein n=1 Tax=Aeromicrobium duanguangcaii TaxID=2968086 RepID=A0ABY5KFX1_9ACTN|nr:condensation domain-containing protein [Aeromicrobium duanguangcaii]MCD9154184.1 condensation domain-containing protein [Aeromicrobium duanguangcaii]UUI68745.1 condensation domain-containing protein [Aeromicrobium duanguangcaii]